MTRPALLVLLLAGACGCGYRAGQVAGGEGRTIAVPLAVNRTYRREVERDLTRALHEEILSRTRYGLVAPADDPDLLLTTTITRIRENVLSQRAGADIRESSVQISVHATLLDRRTGERILDGAPFLERQSFSPVKEESIRSAELAAVRTLAERIVYSMETGW